MSKTIYRVGDQVEIVNPRWIKRVGYPLHWHDLVEEVETDPAMDKALTALGLWTQDVPRYFIQAVAKMRVEDRGFGGNERSIHYMRLARRNEALCLTDMGVMPHHGYVGRVAVVERKRVAYTGTRYPAYGRGEDYEDGGLDDKKAHVILRTTYGEIEACDVKLVKRGAK